MDLGIAGSGPGGRLTFGRRRGYNEGMLVIIGLPLFLGWMWWLWVTRDSQEPFVDPDDEVIQIEITFRTDES